VPVNDHTADLLREYLEEHPNAADPTSPLFPALRLGAQTGPRTQRPRGSGPEPWRSVADRQAHTLAALSVTEAEARLELRLDRAAAALGVLQGRLPAHRAAGQPARPRGRHRTGFRFHSLRHSYVSIAAAAGCRRTNQPLCRAHERCPRRSTSTRTCSPTITRRQWTRSARWHVAHAADRRASSSRWRGEPECGTAAGRAASEPHGRHRRNGAYLRKHASEWRESNPRKRLCRPVPSHSATPASSRDVASAVRVRPAFGSA
jgi:hypothetical protein